MSLRDDGGILHSVTPDKTSRPAQNSGLSLPCPGAFRSSCILPVKADANPSDNQGGPVNAGMTPMQTIVAATSRAAEYLKLDRMGTIAVGKEADFLVLDASPLDRITNTQRISAIYMNGTAVDRAALRSRLARVLVNSTPPA